MNGRAAGCLIVLVVCVLFWGGVIWGLTKAF